MSNVLYLYSWIFSWGAQVQRTTMCERRKTSPCWWTVHQAIVMFPMGSSWLIFHKDGPCFWSLANVVMVHNEVGCFNTSTLGCQNGLGVHEFQFMVFHRGPSLSYQRNRPIWGSSSHRSWLVFDVFGVHHGSPLCRVPIFFHKSGRTSRLYVFRHIGSHQNSAAALFVAHISSPCRAVSCRCHQDGLVVQNIPRGLNNCLKWLRSNTYM